MKNKTMNNSKQLITDLIKKYEKEFNLDVWPNKNDWIEQDKFKFLKSALNRVSEVSASEAREEIIEKVEIAYKEASVQIHNNLTGDILGEVEAEGYQKGAWAAFKGFYLDYQLKSPDDSGFVPHFTTEETQPVEYVTTTGSTEEPSILDEFCKHRYHGNLEPFFPDTPCDYCKSPKGGAE